MSRRNPALVKTERLLPEREKVEITTKVAYAFDGTENI